MTCYTITIKPKKTKPTTPPTHPPVTTPPTHPPVTTPPTHPPIHISTDTIKKIIPPVVGLIGLMFLIRR